MQFFTRQLFFLIIILIGAFWIRQYRINIPLGDWHSWRQVDTAAVSRNFIKEGFDLLHPKYDDMAPVSEDFKPNPQRYRFVEFPIYSAIVALVYQNLNNVEVIYGRQVSVVFSLFSIIFLYLLVKKFSGARVALISAAIFAFLPFNIYFSRVFLPEPMMICATLGSLYFLVRFLEEQKMLFFVLTGFFLNIAILTKPYMLILAIPFVYLIFYYQGIAALKNFKLYLLAFISTMPIIAWRLWMMQYPEGIPSATWLFNGDNIRFKGAFFHWIIGERLGNLILGAPGFFLATLGILLRPKKGETYFFHWWLFATFLYLVILAKGNVEHDYYQIPLVPVLSVMMARAVDFLIFEGRGIMLRWVSILLTVSFLFLTFALTWYYVRGFYQINDGEIMRAGDAAREILPQDAKVIAPYHRNTALLYQLDRSGWSDLYLPIEQMIELGATHYVAVDFNEQTTQISQKYQVIYQDPKFVIVKLK